MCVKKVLCDNCQIAVVIDIKVVILMVTCVLDYVFALNSFVIQLKDCATSKKSN